MIRNNFRKQNIENSRCKSLMLNYEIKKISKLNWINF